MSGGDLRDMKYSLPTFFLITCIISADLGLCQGREGGNTQCQRPKVPDIAKALPKLSCEQGVEGDTTTMRS